MTNSTSFKFNAQTQAETFSESDDIKSETIHHELVNNISSLFNKKKVGNTTYDEFGKNHFYSTDHTVSPFKEFTFPTDITHPKMSSLDCRNKTFISYPSTAPINSIELANAGFFYQGNGDQVACFHCGLFLKNWSFGDNAWIEHSIWNESCPFVLKKKGKSFVKHSKILHHALEDAETASANATKGKGVADIRSMAINEHGNKKSPDAPDKTMEYIQRRIVADALLMGFSIIEIKDVLEKYFYEHNDGIEGLYDMVLQLQMRCKTEKDENNGLCIGMPKHM